MCLCSGGGTGSGFGSCVCSGAGQEVDLVNVSVAGAGQEVDLVHVCSGDMAGSGLVCRETACWCVSQVDPAVYLDTCLYLYCSVAPRGRPAAVCDTLASYARECAQQHLVTLWRTAALCGEERPAGSSS